MPRADGTINLEARLLIPIDLCSLSWQRHSRPATSDREILDDVRKMLDQAHDSFITSGWGGGGGARVLPPRPRILQSVADSHAQRATLAPAPSFEGPRGSRPLQLSTIPLAVIEALGLADSQPTLRGGSNVQMASQLAHLLTRIDETLDSPSGQSSGLPEPVQTAAESIFTARHGMKAHTGREALELLRGMLVDGGVRQHRVQRQVPVDVWYNQLPTHVLQAALELDEDTTDNDGIEARTPTLLQLRRLHDALSSSLAPAVRAERNGASTQEPGPLLPGGVRSGLQAEFKRRVGGSEPASETELRQLAKELLAEADDVRSGCIRPRFEKEASSREFLGGMLPSFGKLADLVYSRRDSEPVGDEVGFPGGVEGLEQSERAGQPSTCSSRDQMVNGFVFVRERDDSHESSRECGGRITETAALRKQTARAGEEIHRKQAFKRLVEKEYELHHIASRKALLNDTILSAVDTIAKSKLLRVETARAVDVPFVSARICDSPSQSRKQQGIATRLWPRLWPAVRMLFHMSNVSRRPPQLAARSQKIHPAPTGGVGARVGPHTPSGRHQEHVEKHASSTTRPPEHDLKDGAGLASMLQQSDELPWAKPLARTAAHFEGRREVSPPRVLRPASLQNMQAPSPAHELFPPEQRASIPRGPQASSSTRSIQCDAPRRHAPILPAQNGRPT